MDALQKITEAQMDANGVCSAPNVLNGTVAQNKAVFDKMVRQLVAPAYNAAVDAIGEINATETGIQAEEALRVTAESGRVNAESGRVSAEAARLSSEALRDSAESARISAETARSAAESGRVNAENGRAGTELERVNAETARAAAEAARAATEVARVGAEAQRAAAESARNVWESFNAAKAYTAGNKVSYLGSSYVCIQAGVGNLPTNTAFWTLIAAKGVDGEGAGDMLATTYDPTGKAQDIFAYADQKASGSAAAVQASLNAHMVRTDNPHGVTAAQIGAAVASHTHTPAQCGADPAGSAAAVLAQLADRAKLATGSYVGTGTSEASNPTTIYFPFAAKILIIEYYPTTPSAGHTGFAVTLNIEAIKKVPKQSGLGKFVGFIPNSNLGQLAFLRSSNDTDNLLSLSIYSTGQDGTVSQFNLLNVTYNWVAIG